MSTPIVIRNLGGEGLSDFGKLSNRGWGAVGKIRILEGGVTGSIFSGGGRLQLFPNYFFKQLKKLEK